MILQKLISMLNNAINVITQIVQRDFMFEKYRNILGLCCLFLLFESAQAAEPAQYINHNDAKVSYDVSMPIDSTGYTLHGKNLMGGVIRFSDQGTYVAPLIAHETGQFELPTVTDLNDKPLINTKIRYNVIKLINPMGIDNFFIKVGVVIRSQKVSGLDPKVLKNGTYTWQVPIFSVGKESNTVDHKSHNIQFMQVGSTGGPASNNVIYTQDFYLYSQGKGNGPIAGHPIKTSRTYETLSIARTDHFTCNAQGLWGAGGADSYRTVVGHCEGLAEVFPAGPNVDYEYGSFKLPTVHTPWSATPSDHCLLNNKRHAGCTNAKIGLSLRYMAQKIRVPISDKVSIFAEFGTAYRRITPENLRYQCKTNVYLKNILPTSDCLKKSYLAGGGAYTYFAIGYEFQVKNGTRYSARYINIPGQENGNRLTWIDASDTQIYAVSGSGNKKLKRESPEAIKKNLNEALDVIRKKNPVVFNVLGKRFFLMP